ncbi:oligosaccharide flippase family protein [Halobaculum sp. EA56]|uniref:oligosaccharide flippase family protein n=1 Tax=Halobaculum sp. EA56 TaxID=3421648 RepID=UPI003EBE683D
MNLPRTVVVDFISRIGRAGISLFAIAVFVRKLGLDAFGIFVLFEASIVFLGIFVDFGIGSAVQKRVAERELLHVVSAGVLLKGGLLMCVTGVVLFLRSPINSYFGAELAIYIPIAVGLQQLSRIGLHALRGSLQVSEASVLQFFGDALYFIFGYLLVNAGFGIHGLVYGFLIGWTFVLGSTFLRIGYRPLIPDTNTARSLVAFSRYSFISSVIGGAIYSWMDTLVIGYFLTPGAVSIYEAAWRISRGVSLISQSIGTALFPQISEWSLAGELDKIRNATKKSTTAALSVVFPAIVGAALIGRQLLEIGFGSETAVGYIPLIVLLIGKGPEAANGVIGRSLYGLDLPRYTAYAAVFFMLVNVLLNVGLVPLLGLFGAASATSLAFGVNAIINGYFLRREVGFGLEWPELGFYLLASLCMGVSLLIFLKFVDINSWSTLAAALLLGVSTYTGGLLIPTQTRRPIFLLINNLR